MKTKHPKYRELEAYVIGTLGRIDSLAVIALEQHLRSCPHCIGRARHAVDFVSLMKGALALQIAGSAHQVGALQSRAA